MNKQLGKIQKVELRKAWKNEAADFTEWLAQKENIALLSKEIGLEMRLTETEAGVGRFSADILAEEESTGKKIIIENQLEVTNHDHLGKIITYASGYNASIVIWVCKEVREEHRQAIDWLNEHTDESVSFFAIKIELWQIDSSSPAPKFQIISSPNEWAKTLKHSFGSGGVSETKLQQQTFWSRFREYAQSKGTKLRLQSPRPQHWYNIAAGTSEAHIALAVNTQENTLGCEIYINKDKELFNFLRERGEMLQEELNADLQWIDAPVASRVLERKEFPSILDNENWEEHHAWLLDRAEAFHKVFNKYLKEYKKRK